MLTLALTLVVLKDKDVVLGPDLDVTLSTDGLTYFQTTEESSYQSAGMMSLVVLKDRIVVLALALALKLKSLLTFLPALRYVSLVTDCSEER